MRSRLGVAEDLPCTAGPGRDKNATPHGNRGPSKAPALPHAKPMQIAQIAQKRKK